MSKRSFDEIFASGSQNSPAIFQSRAALESIPSATADTSAAATEVKTPKKQSRPHDGGRSSVPKKRADVLKQTASSVKTPQRLEKQDEVAEKLAAVASQLKSSKARKKAKPSRSPELVTIRQSDLAAQQPVVEQATSEAEAPPLLPQGTDSPAQKEERLDRTIFVGNIKADIKPKALKQLFARYGKIDSVRIRSIPVKLDAAMPRRAAVLTKKVDAQRATAHAYVVFSQPSEAAAALVQNMQLLDGLHICVNSATGAGSGTASAGSYNKSRSIFVGNLNFAAQDEDLIKLFSDGSKDPQLQDAVTAVRVVRDSKTNIGKGIAFVEFNSKGAAAAAMQLKDLKLDGRPLRISFLKTPKAGAATPVHHAKTPGSTIAKSRIQQREQATSDGKKKPWAGTKAKRIAKPVR